MPHKLGSDRLKSLVWRLLVPAAIIAAAFDASAQVRVDNAWVRATVQGQQSSGAFMTITADSDSRLIGAESPAADIVQLHRLDIQNDVMLMHAVDNIALPAGKPVVLNSSGFHIMLINLKKQICVGDNVPVLLKFEDAKHHADVITVNATARALNTSD